MKTLATIARADWGTVIRSAAYRAAYILAVLIVAAELAYRAGMAAGRVVHWLSDRLGGLASGRIDRAATARAVVAWARATIDAPAPAPAPAPNPAPPMVAMACAAVAPAPAAGTAPPALESLTVAELRAMARARGIAGMGRARRADLLAMLAAPAPIPAAIAAIAAPYDANDGGQCDADAMISAIGRTLDGRDAHLWIDPAGLVWPGANVWGNALPLLSSMREDS